MVKRLRRRPLTAKTGVRVPVAVPNPSNLHKLLGFLYGSRTGAITPPVELGELWNRSIIKEQRYIDTMLRVGKKRGGGVKIVRVG